MDNFTKRILSVSIIVILISIYLNINNAKKQDIEISNLTNRCKELGYTNYSFYNNSCYKVIQEQKTEELYLNNK